MVRLQQIIGTAKLLTGYRLKLVSMTGGCMTEGEKLQDVEMASEVGSTENGSLARISQTRASLILREMQRANV